jgi:hypothetical protein
MLRLDEHWYTDVKIRKHKKHQHENKKNVQSINTKILLEH